MSECVVRMEMPKGNCQLAVEIPYVGDWCPILAKTCDYSMTKKMPKDCPIICALPEGHGPLVDWWDVKKELDQLFSVVVTDEHTGLQHREYPIILEDNPIRIPIIIPATERKE